MRVRTLGGIVAAAWTICMFGLVDNAAAYDYGCSQAYPHRVGISPSSAAGLVTACTTDDRRELMLRNTSLKVLRVWAAANDPFTRIGVDPAPVKGFVTLTVAAAVRPSCLQQVIECTIPSNGTAYAQANGIARLHFEVDPEKSVVANTARGFASWLRSKFQPRSVNWRYRIVSCASNAEQTFSRQSPYLEDALHGALANYSSCRGLMSDVLSAASEKSQVSRSGAISQILGRTKVLLGGAWDDELIAIALRVFARR